MCVAILRRKNVTFSPDGSALFAGGFIKVNWGGFCFEQQVAAALGKHCQNYHNRNYQKTIRKLIETNRNHQKTIRKLSETIWKLLQNSQKSSENYQNYQKSIRKLTENYQNYHKTIRTDYQKRSQPENQVTLQNIFLSYNSFAMIARF